jgi:hypothetical protein
MLYASFDYKLVVLSIVLALFLANAALDSAVRAIAMRTLWNIPRWWRKPRVAPETALNSPSLSWRTQFLQSCGRLGPMAL